MTHPNIVVATNCFLGARNVYTVTQFAGRQNLAQYVSDLPGLRMHENDALSCFYQVASALAYCHKLEVSHRSISLEHVVMKPEGAGRHIPKLVDFHGAMVVKDGLTSVSMFGHLPCMSPEMLRE